MCYLGNNKNRKECNSLIINEHFNAPDNCRVNHIAFHFIRFSIKSNAKIKTKKNSHDIICQHPRLIIIL